MTSSEIVVELCRTNARGALAILDRDLRYVFVTSSWARQFALGAHELVGATLFDALPQLSDDTKACYRRCLDGASETRERDRIVRADGTVAWFSWDARPWWTSASVIGGIAISSELVTDAVLRDEAAAELARLRAAEATRARQLDLLQRAARAIAAIDTTVVMPDLTLLRLVLDQARILSGADYGALGIGTDPERPFEPWVATGLPADQSTAIGAIPRPIGLLGRIARGGETLCLDDACSHGPLALPPHHPEVGPFLGVPLRHRGESFGNLYLAKRPGAAPFTGDELALVELVAERATVAAEAVRLRADLQTRDDAVAILGHDLKGPLQSIALREQVLHREHGAVVGEHTRMVLRTVDAMRRLSLSLVDIASLGAGQLQLDIQTTDTAALVRDVIEIAEPIAAHRNIALEVDTGPAGPCALDRDRMERVLLNLIENAIRYTPQGGRVHVSARSQGGELVLAVADSGSGIAPDEIPRVFERHYTSEPSERGAGLGLYIVKSIVEAHGGRVRVDSELGHGATFVVTLPAQP